MGKRRVGCWLGSAVTGKLLVYSRDALKNDAELGRKLVQFRERWSQLLLEREKLAAALQLALPMDENSPSCLDDLIAMLELWNRSLNRPRDWCDWNDRCFKANVLGLSPLIQNFEEGKISREQLSDVFNRSYYEWWLGKTVDSEDVLRRFSSTEHGSSTNRWAARGTGTSPRGRRTAP
jgi:hypothetical protein